MCGVAEERDITTLERDMVFNSEAPNMDNKENYRILCCENLNITCCKIMPAKPRRKKNRK